VGLTVAKVSEARSCWVPGRRPAGSLPHHRTAPTRAPDGVARRTRVTVAPGQPSFAARQLSEAARAAQQEIGVLAEVDVGLGRVGVAAGEALVQLAQSIAKLPWLRFEGIAFYPGHIKAMDESGRRAWAQLAELLRSMLSDFRRVGIEVGIVRRRIDSDAVHSHELEGLTEIRPGTYVFNDINTVAAALRHGRLTPPRFSQRSSPRHAPGR